MNTQKISALVRHVLPRSTARAQPCLRYYPQPRSLSTAFATRNTPQQLFYPRPSQLLLRRHESSASSPPRPLTDRSDTPGETKSEREEPPSYQMTFTCRKCLHRSSHKISKQGYHHGTTLITCPGCKNRHLISDHLKIFSDKSITLEDILREKGQLLKKGTLSAEGNVEFWDEGTQTKRGE
ncbi:hypothetical protein ANO11243_037350 [Dothideomycetidae sp. 11243]|nr:hypothetical protein ANO11243_037350 [fungal sp. No.11243]